MKRQLDHIEILENLVNDIQNQMGSVSEPSLKYTCEGAKTINMLLKEIRAIRKESEAPKTEQLDIFKFAPNIPAKK